MLSLTTRVSWSGVIIGLLTGYIGSIALANEGGLTLPERPEAAVRFAVSGTPTALVPKDVLQVFVGARDACCAGKSPVAGHHAVEGGVVTFEPAFGWVRGQPYTVRVRGEAGVDTLAEFVLRSTEAVRIPEVVAIYPSGPNIPENTLRFYVHFSTPMQPHLAADHIRLVDASGKTDNAAFMTFKQELWSEDRKRLTLLLDPGRIKRGVAQNIALGPALVAGERYALVVEPGWPSANGPHETSRFEHFFSVSSALRTRPRPALWRIKPPGASTRDPLVIELDRAFDRQLLQTDIKLLDRHGRPVPGTISVEKHEKYWRFDPENPWTDPTLQIAIDPRLEDVAGNNFRELLDHAVQTQARELGRRVLTVRLKPSP